MIILIIGACSFLFLLGSGGGGGTAAPRNLVGVAGGDGVGVTGGDGVGVVGADDVGVADGVDAGVADGVDVGVAGGVDVGVADDGGGHTVDLWGSGTNGRILSCRYFCLLCESPGGGATLGGLSGRGFQLRCFFFKTLMVSLQVTLTATFPGMAEEKTR